MRVLVTGATGCVGRAVVHALRSRGHKVVEGARRPTGTPGHLPIDFMLPRSPENWARELRRLQIEGVVNCVGILMPARGQSFERVHTQGPIELFRGAAIAGVSRVLQVSALGVGTDADSLASPYLHSKLRADEALAASGVDWAVLRPSLIYGPHSHSAALFATLASLPVIGLPGRGEQRVQPLHVFELAEAVARLVEQPGRIGQVLELGGVQAMSYREMLSQYRSSLGLKGALWLPVPMAAMRLGARLAEALPQQVFCRDTLLLLERGSVPARNAAPALLGRDPSTFAHGLAITAPQPLLDLRVQLGAGLARALHLLLALMWLTGALTGAVGLWSSAPAHEGALPLAGWAVAIQLALGLAVLAGGALRGRMGWSAEPWFHALQCAALLGLPVLALFSGAPAVDGAGVWEWVAAMARNLPALGLVVMLWLSAPEARPPVLAARSGAGMRLPVKRRV